MKTCSTCKKDKPLSEFNKKSSNKDGLECYCKECHRARNRKHYAENPAAYKASSEKFKKLLTEWFIGYKSTLQCSICGTDKYWRLDFHHIDPSTKSMGVSEMVIGHKSKENIMKEMDKCIVVCRNCHADIHHDYDNTDSV